MEVTQDTREFLGKMVDGEIPKILLTNESKLDCNQQFVGKCKSCKEYNIQLFLHVWSDKPTPSEETQIMRTDKKMENGSLKMNLKMKEQIFILKK